MPNFIKLQRGGWDSSLPSLAILHGESSFYAAAARVKKKMVKLSELSPADLVLFVKKKSNTVCQGLRNARVSIRDSAISLRAVWKEGASGRRKKERDWKEIEKEENNGANYIISLTHRSRGAVVQASRKIDKKRRFVKCRGRFSLLAATVWALAGARGWKRKSKGDRNDSHPWVLTIVPVSIGTWFAQPFRRHRVDIGDTLMRAVLALDSSSLSCVQWVLFREDLRRGTVVDSPYTPRLSIRARITVHPPFFAFFRQENERWK